MRGRTRAYKKHIKTSGWHILKEGRQEDGSWGMVLKGPRGERMKVHAPDRPHAYRHAERQVLGTEPGRALWAPP